jgi:hypothetical protein
MTNPTPEDIGGAAHRAELNRQALELFSQIQPDGQRLVFGHNGLSMRKQAFTRDDLDILRRADAAGILRDRPMKMVEVRDEYSASRQYHHIAGPDDGATWAPFANRLKIGKFGNPDAFKPVKSWWNK